MKNLLSTLFKGRKQQCNIPFVSNSCYKTIVWGAALFDIQTGKDADVHITNIHVDSMNDEVTVIREIGLDVKRIVLTMEHAREIGFINLNALSNHC